MTLFDRKNVILGHRGVRPIPHDARAGLPIENTIAAFERAIEEGADGVELDVRLCKTGEPVVLHDRDLARVFGDPRRIEDVPLADLPREIPTLAQALDFCAAKNIGVNIELKYDVPDKRALAWASAKAIEAARADVLVSSFDPRVLIWLAARLPRVRRAWLVNATQWNIERAIDLLARRFALFAVHLERRLASPARVSMLARRGLKTGVWTIVDPREAKSCFSIGVDWVITDCPGEVRHVVKV